MSVRCSRERFEALVDRALDEIPDEIAAVVRNVVVLVEDRPPADQPEDLLGLYVGVALTERDSTTTMSLPDQIFVFREPLLEYAGSEDDLVREVRVTVVHEVAHHFGIDEDRLHDLGYG